MPESAGHRVTVLVCEDCGALDPGPRAFCRACQSSALVARDVDGTGMLVSWTMIRRPPTAFREEGEYAVAVVALDAGVQVTGRLALDGGEPRPGSRVAMVDSRDGVGVFATAP